MVAVSQQEPLVSEPGPAIATIFVFILDRDHIGQLAYVAGSLGTLIGADLMNLDKVTGPGAPVVSIGGAGTFDGIFLTGIVAVLLGSVASRGAAKAAASRPKARLRAERLLCQRPSLIELL